MFWTEYSRDVVEVVGPDAATYLQSQVSNDLRPMQVGDSRWSLLLQPTGKVDVLLRVWRVGDDRFVLDTDAGFGAVLVARLNRFKIRVKADIAALDWSCIAVRGASGQGLVAWGEGYDLIDPSPSPPVDVPHGSADDLLAARIDAVWPAMGAEIVPGESIPAELGVNDVAVSFTKGCYPGQELVERMDSRAATAPRSLRRLRIADHPGRDYTSTSGEWGLAYVPRSEVSG
jgi:folate-binding protein YgfZ